MTSDPDAAADSLDRLLGLVAAARFRFATEKDLQAGIAGLLAEAGVPFAREARLAPGDVIDFLVGGAPPAAGPAGPAPPDLPRVGLEVKLGGTATAVAAQLLRYAASPELAGLLLVTARSRHHIYPGPAPELGGKPLRVLVLRGGF